MSLGEEGDEYYIIWTFNLDKRVSRSQGRKIPKRFAVKNVKLSELIKACEELGVEFIPEEKKFPKRWWEDGGRVKIKKIGKKGEIMLKLAKIISENRKYK